MGKAVNLYEDAGYKLHGSAYVINKLLGTTWSSLSLELKESTHMTLSDNETSRLWDRVRVSGGAYGGFSDFDSQNGMLTFLSYRDPNLVDTVRDFLWRFKLLTCGERRVRVIGLSSVC